MLRASSQYNDLDVDLDPIRSGAAGGDGGVEHGDLLLAYADAVFARDSQGTEITRGAVLEALGPERTAEAAGVIANFHRMVRIADGTAIPLDEFVRSATAKISDRLGLREYGSAAHTPKVGFVKRLLEPLAWKAMGRMTRKAAEKHESDVGT